MAFLRHFVKKENLVLDEPTMTYMIAGLGNPGREYRETRHNIGFMVADVFATRHGIQLSRVQNKAILGIGRFADKKIILVKPQTFMNLSGQAVSALVRFYKIPIENLIVAHDDVDLPLGTIRMRPGGGSAGQKGVNSIIERLGSQDFPRLRMGVGRPPGQMDAAGYVLLPFHKNEKDLISEFLIRAADALDCFIEFGLETAMNRFNINNQGSNA